jgi:hypothetical protein
MSDLGKDETRFIFHGPAYPSLSLRHLETLNDSI